MQPHVLPLIFISSCVLQGHKLSNKMGGKRFSFNVTIKENALKEINTLVKSNTIQDSDIPVKVIKVISDK